MRERGSYLSAEERTRRIEALRAVLSEAHCTAALIVGTPHVGGKRYFRYFTDWNIQSIGAYALIRADGHAELIFRASSQAFWAGLVGWVQDIISTANPWPHVLERVQQWERVPRIALVGKDYFPVADYLTLLSTFAGHQVEDITARVDQLMALKYPEEQALLRESGAIFDAAWQAVLDHAAPGMSEWDLAGVAASAVARRGVPHNVILIGASNPDFKAKHAGWPRDRRISAADIIQMSIEGPGPNGYWVEIGGTFSFRPPDDAMRRQFDAQVAGMQAALEELRPGRSGGDVAVAVERAFRQRGLSPGYWAGHGIGLGVPERPFLEAGEDAAVVAGTAVALHPNPVSQDGRGTLLSRTYLIQAGGPEPVSRFPLEWVQV